MNLRQFVSDTSTHFKRGLKIMYQHHFYIPYNVYIRRRMPVVVYQMGKVGSTAVYNALRESSFVTQVHTLNAAVMAQRRHLVTRHNRKVADLWYYSPQIRRHILARDVPIKIITLVREPISRNVSSFFQNLVLHLGQDVPASHMTIPELTRLFIERTDHKGALEWFDYEYAQVLGIDIYQHPFSHESGALRLTQGQFDVLVLRLETERHLLEQHIADFLDLPGFKLQEANVSVQKQYGERYAAFKKEAILPADYLDWMLNARYTRHFYTAAYLQEVRERWQQRLATG